MININSLTELTEKISGNERALLLLYKSDSEQSGCAYQNLGLASMDNREVPVYTADVTTVRDIHTKYGITTVPAILVFNKGNYENVIKGCHDRAYYKNLIDNTVYQIKSAGDGKSSKQVTVYSTPTCSWCNTLKSWLRKNNIRYSDIDVSRDQHAAEALVRRSGQQGVPQTDINGSIVVGFNQARLKELLEIQ